MGREYRPNVPLRNARLMRNWTYKEAARELNLLMLSRGETQAAVTLQMVYRWERGEVGPSMFYRRYFCLLYGLRPDELGFVPKECAAGENAPAAAAVDTPQQRKPLAAEGAQPSPSATGRHEASPSGGVEEDLEAMNLTRRQLLAASGLLGAAVGTETAAEAITRAAEPVERAARVASGRAAADDALIADMTSITTSYERACGRMPGGMLIEPVHAHITMMGAVLRQSLLPKQREAVLCNASQAASLLSTMQLFDMGDQPAAQHWLSQSVQMAEETTDPSMHVLGLLRVADQYLYGGHAGTSVQLLEQARRLADRKCSPNVQSWVLASQAEAHATLRQSRGVPELLDLAAEAEQRSQPEYEPSWAGRWGRSRVAGYIGTVHLRLEQPGPARAALHEALAALDPSAVKRRSIYLVDLAMTHTLELEIENACELAGKALELAGPMHYRVTVNRVDGLRRRLAPWEGDRAVKDLDERLRAVGPAAT